MMGVSKDWARHPRNLSPKYRNNYMNKGGQNKERRAMLTLSMTRLVTIIVVSEEDMRAYLMRVLKKS